MEYLAKKPILVIFVLTLFFTFLFDFVFGLKSSTLSVCIAGGLAVFLSPRKKKIKTQAGEKNQITWVFLKKTIIID